MNVKVNLEFVYNGDDFIRDEQAALWGGIPVAKISGMGSGAFEVEVYKPFRKFNLNGMDVFRTPDLKQAEGFIHRSVSAWLNQNIVFED